MRAVAQTQNFLPQVLLLVTCQFRATSVCPLGVPFPLCTYYNHFLGTGKNQRYCGGGVVGRAVLWGVVTLRMQGPSETAHLQIPSCALTGGLSE